MMIHAHKELNESRPFVPRFRRFHKFSGTTIVTEGDKFCFGEKMSGFSFVVFGRMISIWITKEIKPEKRKLSERARGW
jgi:hypothetical protein